MIAGNIKIVRMARPGSPFEIQTDSATHLDTYEWGICYTMLNGTTRMIRWESVLEINRTEPS